jgi:DNA-binding transcriptional ArsR family regulator
MVEYESHDLDTVFHALADPTRRAMLRVLSVNERTVTELAAPFDMSLAAASKHVKVLERAGLIERTVEGRTHVCRLQAKPMHSTLEWIRYYEKFWGDRLDILESRLVAEDEIAARKPRKRRSKK